MNVNEFETYSPSLQMRPTTDADKDRERQIILLFNREGEMYQGFTGIARETQTLDKDLGSLIKDGMVRQADLDAGLAEATPNQREQFDMLSILMDLSTDCVHRVMVLDGTTLEVIADVGERSIKDWPISMLFSGHIAKDIVPGTPRHDTLPRFVEFWNEPDKEAQAVRAEITRAVLWDPVEKRVLAEKNMSASAVKNSI